METFLDFFPQLYALRQVANSMVNQCHLAVVMGTGPPFWNIRAAVDPDREGAAAVCPHNTNTAKRSKTAYVGLI